MVSMTAIADNQPTVAAALARGCPLIDEGNNQELSSNRPMHLGLATKRECLETLGLFQDMVCTIQSTHEQQTAIYKYCMLLTFVGLIV